MCQLFDFFVKNRSINIFLKTLKIKQGKKFIYFIKFAMRF